MSPDMTSKIYNLMFFVFLLFVFFPYVTPIKTGSDIQPYSMVVAFLLVFLYGFRHDILSYCILIFLFISMSFLFFTNIEFSDVRSSLSPISFCLVFLALHNGIQFFEKNVYDFLLWLSLWLYFFASIIQSIFGAGTLLFISPRYFTYGGFQGRGYDSLTAEPTFYGFTILLLCMIYSLLSFSMSRKVLFYWFVGFVQILLFAKSSSALLSFLIVFFVFSIVLSGRLKYFYLCMSIFSFVFLYFVVDFLIYFMEDGSRVKDILSKANDPVELITTDYSINDRLFNIYYSYKGAFSNYFIPHGFGNWYEYLISAASSNNLVTNVSGEDERILSMFGGLLFEFGFFSIFFFFLVFYGVYIKSSGSTINFLLLSLALIFVFSQAIPISHPLVALFICFLYIRPSSNGSCGNFLGKLNV
ncbi:MAG: hypothetical protein ACI9ES_000249 [Oceanospirillaceae bacterium]|jgi:hypothetical protein